MSQIHVGLTTKHESGVAVFFGVSSVFSIVCLGVISRQEVPLCFGAAGLPGRGSILKKSLRKFAQALLKGDQSAVFFSVSFLECVFGSNLLVGGSAAFWCCRDSWDGIIPKRYLRKSYHVARPGI